MPYPALTGGLVLLAALFVLLMVPVSFAYDRKYRATVAEYAELRRASGADTRPWPPSRLRREIFLSPGLVLGAGILAAALSVFGAIDEVLRTDPFGMLPGFVADPRLPALLPAVVVGLAAAVVLVAYAIYGFWSPWWPVQLRLRMATGAKRERREVLLAQALGKDPSLKTNGVRR